MRKFMLFAACLFLAAHALSEPAQGIGRIGLYASDTHDNFCVAGSGMYQVEMWVWCLPGNNGQICAEFRVQYPTNVITSDVTGNAMLNSVTLGDLASGMSVCYVGCQYNWNWPFHQTLYVTSAEVTSARIVAHPLVGVYQFANCMDGFPLEECIGKPGLLINVDQSDPKCIGGTADATWGAIKGMYNE